MVSRLPFWVMCLLVTLSSSQNILEKFVIDRLANYGSWIKSNNLDPSATIAGPTLIQASDLFVTMDCYLGGHQVRGHSDGINVTSVKADLDRISVTFEIQNNITFSGRYIANGTVWFDIPVTGDGLWSMTIPKVTLRDFYFDYAISDAGYVYITSFDFDRLTFPDYYDNGVVINFDNLWDKEELAEYEETIKRSLYGAYRAYVFGELEHPLKDTYLQYFQQVFQNTTWADIIIQSTSTVIS